MKLRHFLPAVLLLSFFSAGCSNMDLTPPSYGDRAVEGTVVFSHAGPLPENAEVIVQVVDPSRGGRGEVLGEQIIKAPGEPPIALHWIIALLIMLNFAAAWVAEGASKADAAVIMGNHKAIGITVLLLTVVRMLWRLGHRPPPLLDSLKAWEAALAKVTHGLFYLLMLAVPLAGWGLHSAARGTPVSLFGLVDFPALPVGSDKPTIGLFHELHEMTATLMLVLFLLHVAGALKHQFLDHDGTLRRMVPWMR